jgi:hypothetical protein
MMTNFLPRKTHFGESMKYNVGRSIKRICHNCKWRKQECFETFTPEKSGEPKNISWIHYLIRQANFDILVLNRFAIKKHRISRKILYEIPFWATQILEQSFQTAF